MHTVAEVGFWRNPKVLAFAVKVGNPDAGAWILRLREFVLLHGTDDGKLPGFTADEIAAIVSPTCKHSRLFTALKTFNWLKQRRRTWFVPDWGKSAMGQYCKMRAWDRLRKKELREAGHEAALEKVNGNGADRTSGGRPVDVPGTSSGKAGVSKEGRPVDAPPRPPLKGGTGAALTRWEWFKNTHPRLKNPAKCQRVLAELTPDEWEHLQFALPKQALIYMSRGKRWVPWADKYLDQRMFLEIAKVTPAKSVTKKEAKAAAKKAAEEDPKAVAHRYLVALLADHEAPEKKKQQAKDHWEKTYGDRPWEKGFK